MKRFKILKSFITLLLLASCSQSEGLPDASPVGIHLSGDVGGVAASATTRSVVGKDYFTANNLDVCFLRIDQGLNGVWQSYTDVAAPLAATRAKGAGVTAISFADAQYYLVGNEHNATKLIGWYPKSGVYAQATGKVTFDIGSGTTDVMLTNEVQGDKVNKFGTAPRTFTFGHLLTRITVKAFASVDVTASKWGKVTAIKVKGQPTECRVAVPNRTPTWGETTQSLLLRKVADDAVMSDIDLNDIGTSDAAVVCGYAMFKPTAGNVLTLEVTTEKGGVRDITVGLPAGADPQHFAAGTAYTVTLEFKSTLIAPTATITDWTNHGDKIPVEFD